MRPATFIPCLLFVSVWAVVGCSNGRIGGYGTGHLYDPSPGTVWVPIFENKTFYLGVERDLTEALIKQISRNTPYSVVNGQGAHTKLSGTITGIEQENVSMTQIGGVAQQRRVTVTIDFQWKDLRTGKVIRRRDRFQGVGEFVPVRPVHQGLDIGLHSAVVSLADQIVCLMQRRWDTLSPPSATQPVAESQPADGAMVGVVRVYEPAATAPSPADCSSPENE